VPQQESISKIMFEIQADMWAQPYPERLFLKTELDLDLAQISLTEFSSART
jgi:type VI secretion system protein ImpF